MKFRSICIAVAACLALAMVVHAATRQWSYVVSGLPYQLTCDGKGGCAFVWISTGGVARVVWLDKKGAVKYEKQLNGAFAPFAIAQLTPKLLAYVDSAGGNYNLVSVDKKGQESTVTGPTALAFSGGYPYPFSKSMDKKGFFVTEVNTNVVPATYEIVRYSNK